MDSTPNTVCYSELYKHTTFGVLFTLIQECGQHTTDGVLNTPCEECLAHYSYRVCFPHHAVWCASHTMRRVSCTLLLSGVLPTPCSMVCLTHQVKVTVQMLKLILILQEITRKKKANYSNPKKQYNKMHIHAYYIEVNYNY